MHSLPNQNLILTVPKCHTNKLDLHKMKMKQKDTRKGSEYWLNQPSTSNRYTALLEEESGDQQHKTSPENMSKPPPSYILVTVVKNILPHT
jgi:hypothetical protein